MTVRKALVSRTLAPTGAVRWMRAAVIAVFAALAVLVHHEIAVGALTPTQSSGSHLMPGVTGMVMSHDSSGQAVRMPGHAYHGTSTPPAEPSQAAVASASTMTSGEGLACSGMLMQHCASASVDAVKFVPPPAETWVPSDLDRQPAATVGSKAAGTVGRAPPDLSVLSQLRI
ncbi:hypothetical protein [Streptomyces regalis]|uniref:Uncharacterized protein n=1 Tax=Streptomyces regalis TaxID=68262 RepID=A0A0X3VQF7_9ACTN|nr:hypothetical protein [Streptomyces regalis]KUL47001.1 hypothetical protein ADL12_00730 [Streptomyces regalis]